MFLSLFQKQRNTASSSSFRQININIKQINININSIKKIKIPTYIQHYYNIYIYIQYRYFTACRKNLFFSLLIFRSVSHPRGQGRENVNALKNTLPLPTGLYQQAELRCKQAPSPRYVSHYCLFIQWALRVQTAFLILFFFFFFFFFHVSSDTLLSLV